MQISNAMIIAMKINVNLISWLDKLLENIPRLLWLFILAPVTKMIPCIENHTYAGSSQVGYIS